MNILGSIIGDKFLYYGTNDSMKNITVKKAVQMNIISLITFASFQFFYIILLFLSNAGKDKIYFSYFLILFLAFITFLLSVFKKRLATKIFLVSTSYLGVFFFDVYLGSSVGLAVYYFPFLFVTIKIFSFKKENIWLIIFILLPLLLNVLSGTILKSYYDTSILTSQNVRNLRTFNFTLAFFLIVMYANYIINYEIKNDAIIENSKISLQTIIDNTNGSLWSIDNNFEIIAANKLYTESMKLKFNVKIEAGFDVKKLMYHKDFPEEWLMLLKEGLEGKKIIKEYSINGVVHEIQTAPIIKDDNKIMGAVFHDTNINVRKEYERNYDIANAELQNAVKSKEQFLSNMSHELRTPLNGIIGISNILLSEQKLEAQNENLEMLKYSADHMLDIVNDILDYNKIDAKKVELENVAFDITTLINKVAIFFNQQALQKGIKLFVDTDSVNQIIVTGDALRLRQILNNLISNAIKFTNRGVVSIVVKKVLDNEDGTVKINFAIVDSGIGIAGNKLKLIFNSFGQADNGVAKKYGGTGLGLTISARLVELMDSKINVDSVHGKGSTFSFELDMGVADEKSITHLETNNLNSFEGIKALLAEDNKINLMVIKRFLNSWGIETVSVENGERALQLAKVDKFDMILMDLNMPLMDGRTAALRIRKFNQIIPIIAITASTGENLKNELLGFGINDYIPKPFSPDVLHKVISKILAK